MQWLALICVKRAVFASVLMLAIVVVGGVGYTQLGVDAFPKIDFPVISVITRLDGAAPEEVETQITDKVEAAVNTIAGIDELRSTSSEGVSQVFVTFVLDKDIDAAAQDVRDHVSQALTDLPKGIDAPVIAKLDPDASPILYLSVAGNRPLRDLTELADKRIRRAIESIPGVGKVSIVGGRKRQLNVLMDAQALAGFGLSAGEVQQAIAGQNLTAPGGNLETGPKNIVVRVKGRVEDPGALGRIIVRQVGAHAIRLSDVARIEDSMEEEQTAAVLNGQPALILSLRKQTGENTVATVEAVKDRLADVQKTLPDGVSLQVVRDASRTIQTQVDAVKEHLILGALFAALVVLVFLGNVRSTFIAALAIPISIIGTFALMWIKGFTLNIITLLALALAVGIVIDDAIVVLENIVRFVEEKKQKPYVAALNATRDIGLAVLATTLSLIAVFLPVAFMGGIVGRFLNSFGLTMAFAIGVSLLVSFTLTPMLSARWLKPYVADETPNMLLRLVDVFYRPIERVYMVMLRWSMSHRWAIMLMCCAALGSCVPMFKAVPKSFLPINDEANFEVNLRAPEGMSLQATLLEAERLARQIKALAGVNETLTSIGDNEQKTANQAKIYVRLVDPKERLLSQQQTMNKARDEVLAQAPADLRTDVSEVSAFNSGQSSKTVQYIISGPDLGLLGDAAQRIVAKMKKTPGIVDADSSLILGTPEVHLEILRERAMDMGVDVAAISNTVRLAIGGLKVSTYEESGEDFDIYMRLRASDRVDPQTLGMLTIATSRGTTVFLRDVVNFVEARGPSQIDRLARRRQVTLSCNVVGIGESEAATFIEQFIGEEKLSPEYASQAFGRTRESARAGKSFGAAFGLSFVFMYLILAAQFESWLHPFTILLSLPLTLPFAMLSLLLFKQPLSIQSALGLLVLFGVVKKNAILQVDHTNTLRAEGMQRLDAILLANKDRLRPILMTTVAFVAGMMPLITAQGIGAGFNRATAGIVVGGQSFSLLLTLLATPVIYALLDDARDLCGRLLGSSKGIDRGRDLVLSGKLDA